MPKMRYSDLIRCLQAFTEAVGIEDDQAIEVPIELLKFVSSEIRDMDPWGDYSVGIPTAYDLVEALRVLELAEQSHVPCTVCDPDLGWVFREEHNDDCLNAQALGFDCEPDCHMEKCPVCDGRTSVPLVTTRHLTHSEADRQPPLGG